MAVLVWLLVPLIVTVGAFVVVGARHRPERPAEAERSMQDLDRFREAMSRPMPAATADPAAPTATEAQFSPGIELKAAPGKGIAAA